MRVLSPADLRRVLEVLDEDGGFMTGAVTTRVRALHGIDCDSRWIRAHLLDLHRSGFVQCLDDEKPVCWQRTAAGTSILADITTSRTGE